MFLIPKFYGNLVYKFKKIVNTFWFSVQFIVKKKIGNTINGVRQNACLVVKPITVDTFAFLFNCTPDSRTPDSVMFST